MNQYKMLMVFACTSLVMVAHSFPLAEHYNSYPYGKSCKNSTVVLYENDIKALHTFMGFFNSMMSQRRYQNPNIGQPGRMCSSMVNATMQAPEEGQVTPTTVQTTNAQGSSTTTSTTSTTTTTTPRPTTTTMRTTTTIRTAIDSSGDTINRPCNRPYNRRLIRVYEMPSEDDMDLDVDYNGQMVDNNSESINQASSSTQSPQSSSSTPFDPTTNDVIFPSSSTINPSSTSTGRTTRFDPTTNDVIFPDSSSINPFYTRTTRRPSTVNPSSTSSPVVENTSSAAVDNNESNLSTISPNNGYPRKRICFKTFCFKFQDDKGFIY